jgi:P2-related tail formation protein
MTMSSKKAKSRKNAVAKALRIVLALLMFCAPAAASEIEMSRPEGHPQNRFPLAVYAAPMADATQAAAVRRAAEDWNSVFRRALGMTAFRWTTRAEQAAVSLVLAPRTSTSMMGVTEIGADENGVIELPVRITLLEPTARGQTSRETLLYEVAAHELGHALGLPHTTDPRSVMCCVWGGLDFKDPSVRAAYIDGRRHPDLRSVEVQLKAHYQAFWKEP